MYEVVYGSVQDATNGRDGRTMVVYRVGSEPSEYATIYVRDTEEFLMKFEEIR